jgi:hypothetical protein
VLQYAKHVESILGVLAGEWIAGVVAENTSVLGKYNSRRVVGAR